MEDELLPLRTAPAPAHRGVSHRSFSSANWQIFLERMRIAQVLNKRNQWATVCETYL
jgi:hypothetical protein